MHHANRLSRRHLRPWPAVLAGALCAALLVPAAQAGGTAEAARLSTRSPGSAQLLAEFRADATRVAVETAMEVTRDLSRRLRHDYRSWRVAAERRVARDRG